MVTTTMMMLLLMMMMMMMVVMTMRMRMRIIMIIIIVMMTMIRRFAAFDYLSIIGVQAYLTYQGYDVGPVDGWMGPKTENALMLFQVGAGVEMRSSLMRIVLCL